jgi:tetratricopeptide (TPR) repeat protein
MAKSIKQRFQAYSTALKDQIDRGKQREAPLKATIAACWEETRKFARQLAKGETSNERKQAIELVKRAMAEYNAKQYPVAEEFFRRAIGKDPGYARAHTYLGNTLYKMKRYTDAMTSWQKAVEAEPSSDAAETARQKIRSVSKGRDGALEIDVDLVRSRG